MYKTRLLSLSAFCTKYQKSLLLLISAEDQSHPLGRTFRFCDYSNKPMEVSGHRPSVSGSRKAQKPTARKKAKQPSMTGCWFTLAEPQVRDSKSSAEALSQAVRTSISRRPCIWFVGATAIFSACTFTVSVFRLTRASNFI